MPLRHAQNVVKADFFMPPFDQKTVGIQQKYDGKNPDHNGSQIHNGRDCVSSRHIPNFLVPSQKGNIIEHSHSNDPCQQVGKHKAAVTDQISGGHLGEKEFTHGQHPLWPGRLRCPRSV